jgi:hypothetical protein
VVNTISLPSGDHDGPPTLRVKKSSSMGIALAAGLEGEATDFGSVTWRSSGPDDAASTTVENKITRARPVLTSNPRRRRLEFANSIHLICTSVLSSILLEIAHPNSDFQVIESAVSRLGLRSRLPVHWPTALATRPRWSSFKRSRLFPSCSCSTRFSSAGSRSRQAGVGASSRRAKISSGRNRSKLVPGASLQRSSQNGP